MDHALITELLDEPYLEHIAGLSIYGKSLILPYTFDDNFPSYLNFVMSSKISSSQNS